eukprot:371870-Hanusia_phi.AAC.1
MDKVKVIVDFLEPPAPEDAEGAEDSPPPPPPPRAFKILRVRRVGRQRVSDLVLEAAASLPDPFPLCGHAQKLRIPKPLDREI